MEKGRGTVARNLFQNKTKTVQAAPSVDQNEEIAKLAYQFFSDRGGEHGHDQEDWVRAAAVIQRKSLNKDGR